MTSIFSDKFLGNMERINAKARSTPSKTSAPEGFAKVLADIERNAKKASDSGDLSGLVEKAAAELKVQVPSASTAARARLSASPPVAIPEPELPPTPAATDGGGVKTPAEPVKVPVKNTPPETPVPVVRGAAPQAPQVVTARRLTSAPPVPVAVSSPPESIKEVVLRAGRHHGVDPALGLAVASVESAFDHRAVSKDGHASKGIFQLLDSTGKEQHAIAGIVNDYDPFNPEMNAHLGVGYLRRLMEMFSEETKLTSRISTVAAKSAEDLEKLAVAAFNAGQGRVALAQRRAQALGNDPTEFAAVEPHLPASTREYVQRVLSSKLAFAAEDDESTTA